MNTKSMIMFCLALPMLMAFNVCSNGTKPKVYKDTIYRFPPKRQPAVVDNTPEELRNIRITDTIIKFKVKKSERKLYAYFGDTFKVFKISLGASPIGHKIKQGDHKTPEGTYFISFKNPKSRGYKSLKLSYPNAEDKKRAAALKISPGGDICIHGLWWDTQDPKTHWKDDWTEGCLAVNNQEIDEIYAHTYLKTPISILP